MARGTSEPLCACDLSGQWIHSCTVAARERHRLKHVVVRYQGKASRIYFRADAVFAMPGIYEYLEAGRIKYLIRLPANQVLQSRSPTCSSARSGDLRRSCKFHPSGMKLDQTAPGDRQSRVAPR